MFIKMLFFVIVHAVPQMLTYRPNPVCIYPQAQTVQALPVPQSTFMPQTQFITPVANGAPVNRKQNKVDNIFCSMFITII